MNLEDHITAALADYDKLPADVEKVRDDIRARLTAPPRQAGRALLIAAAVIAVLAVATAVPLFARNGSAPSSDPGPRPTAHHAPPLTSSAPAPSSSVTFGTSQGPMPEGIIPPGQRKPASPFTLPWLRGRGRFSLTGHRGRIVVVTWSASWCAPCRTAYRDSLREPSLRSRDTTVVTIDTADNRRTARAFFHPQRVKSLLVFDRAGTTLPRETGGSALPITVVVDRQQRIAAVFRGIDVRNRVALAVEGLTH